MKYRESQFQEGGVGAKAPPNKSCIFKMFYISTDFKVSKTAPLRL
jgi:hypothetical protein